MADFNVNERAETEVDDNGIRNSIPTIKKGLGNDDVEESVAFVRRSKNDEIVQDYDDIFYEGDINDTEEVKDANLEENHNNLSHSPSYTEDGAVDITVSDETLKIPSRSAKKRKAVPPKECHESRVIESSSIGSRSKKHNSSGTTVCRTPSVHGLTIPFRTIKKAMKLDPDIPIVQNEAAIMTTVAVELFLKRLVVQSNQNAKNRGRNTVRYEDVAEARTTDNALSFLEPLLP